MTVIKFIPQLSLHGICQDFPCMLLFGIEWWWGHVCTIRMCLSIATSDKRICIMHAWPHHHSIPNNNMHGRSWCIPCRDCWGMNFKSRFGTAKYGNIQFWNDCHKFIPQRFLHGIHQKFQCALLVGIRWWWGYVCMIWMCLFANILDLVAPNLRTHLIVSSLIPYSTYSMQGFLSCQYFYSSEGFLNKCQIQQCQIQ
jgi:hypothetical protein